MVVPPNINLKPSIGFFLECNAESDSESWSCYASAILRLKSQKEGIISDYERKILHVFYPKENDWGYSTFLSWDKVLDPKNGYIKNGSVTFEINVLADVPHGVQWNIPIEGDILFTPSETRTFCVIVEDRVLYVSKELLALYSPVFQLMFYGDFKEAKENRVVLKEKKLSEILEFFHVLFPLPVRKVVNWGNVEMMLNFADEYDIEDLKTTCRKALFNCLSHLSIGNNAVLEVVQWASKFWFQDIIAECIPYVASLPDDLLQSCIPKLHSRILAAVNEAKYNGLKKVKTSTTKLTSASSSYAVCQECYKPCGKCKPDVYDFHTKGCSQKNEFNPNDTNGSSSCLCGFDFNHELLRKDH